MPNDNKNNKQGAGTLGDKYTPEIDLLEIEKDSLDSSEVEATADIDRIEQKMSKTMDEAMVERKSEHRKKADSVEEATNTEEYIDAEKTDGAERGNARRNSTGRMALKVFGILLGIAVLAVVVYGLRVWLAYNGFLDKVTGNEPETKEYSVLVLSNSNTNEIHELERKNIGFLETDPKAGNAEQYLQSVVKFEASYYEDLGMLASVLNDKISDAIVLESDWLQALEDESQNSMKDTRVIYTFNIELNSEDIEISQKDVTKEPFIVLISGTDSRAGVKATARSDVNIVAVVNPAKEKILLVSIPRDTYVQLHGTTGLKDKLTHAGVYGVNMSKNTIEDFLGIQIDDTVKVGFDTVVKVVDQLDGITIDSDQEMTLKAEGKDKTCHYTVGKQQVDGDCALRFARERKSYATGDRHRGENQQQVISAIIDKLAHSKNHVLKLPTILDIAADSFETSLSKDAISSLIRMQLIDNPNWKVESIAINGTGTMLPTYSMGANLPLYVMIPSDETIVNAQNKINEYLR